MKPGVQWLVNAWRKRGGDQATNVLRAEAVMGCYRRTFDPTLDHTRPVLADLALYCNVAATSFVAGDPHQTAFNEGRRDAFNHIAEMLGLVPDDFPKLVQEQTP